MTMKGDIAIELELDRIADRARDFSPVMERIRDKVFAPAIGPAWASSGLHELTGELRDATTAWSGKRSAGVTLRTSKGKDLVLPKAATHTNGRAKQAKVRKKTVRIKAHTRGGKSVGGYERKNLGGPWGDIPARPFFPADEVFTREESKMKTMIEEYLCAAAR